MIKKQWITYSVISTLLLNTCLLTELVLITSISSFFSQNVYAETVASDTQKLDELKARYNINSSNRHHQEDTLPQSVQDLIDNPPASRDLSGRISNVLSDPIPTRTRDLNRHDLGLTMTEESKNQAARISKTQGQPEQSASGTGFTNSYSKSGTREFYRDANGKLQLKVIEGVERVNGLENEDILGYEGENETYSGQQNKQDMYGDGQAIFDEGSVIHQANKDPNLGKNASARGYRVITSSATRANNTSIAPDAGWLAPSFQTVKDVEDNTGLFEETCTEVEIDRNQEIEVPQITEHFCQDTGQLQFDFCEVERDIKIPAWAPTAGLRSCGVGCYEMDTHINTRKSSKCRRTYGSTVYRDPWEFTIQLNAALGIKIKKVTIKGDAADHFKYSVNGESVWASTGNSQSRNGNLESGSCNKHSHMHQIDVDVTDYVKEIVGPIEGDGLFPIHFRGDIRWKSNGHLNSTIRIEIESIDGSTLEDEYIQHPEGCYDALRLEDKQTRGLRGLTNGIGSGTPPSSTRTVRYQCSATPATPICETNQYPFGHTGRESCFSEPIIQQTCSAGTYNSENNRCEYTADSTCSLGGTLDGDVCVIPYTESSSCSTGGALTAIIKLGESLEQCKHPITQLSSQSWNCSNVEGTVTNFDSSICTVYPETYLDEFDNLIPTIDDGGFPLPAPVDSEGQPIVFQDTANCEMLFQESVTSLITSAIDECIPADDGADCEPFPEPDPNPVVIPSGFCTFDDYETIEDGNRNLPPEIIQRIPQWFTGDAGNKTWKVNLNGYRCDPTDGHPICNIDPATGQEVCYTWEDLRNQPNACQEYFDDPNCSEIARDCPTGWFEPITGRCLSETVTFSCDNSSVIDFPVTETTNICIGMLPCSGGECEIGEPEVNTNFVKAMVASGILTETQGDLNCTNPDEPQNCQIFKGEYKYCSWELTGLGSDCCEEADGVNVMSYVLFTYQMVQVGEMGGYGVFSDGVQGAYDALAEPVADAWSAVSEWTSSTLRSASDSVFGNTDSISNGVSAISDGISSALSALQQEVYSFVYDMLPDTLGNLIFEEVAVEGASEGVTELAINDTLSSFISGVMAVYMVYQLLKLALTLLTACDDVEMDMGVRLAQRTCFKVDDPYCSLDLLGACIQKRQNYCCFPSLLSRIIMKEAYTQLNIDPLPFGSTTDQNERDQSCMGVTPEQLGMIDFDAPDMQNALQEWVGIMIEGGKIPSEINAQLLTGGATYEETECDVSQQVVYDEDTGLPVRDSVGNIVYQEVRECWGKASAGRVWNAEDRVVITDRVPDYLQGAEDRVPEARAALKNVVINLDCSVSPRPPVCEFGFDPTEGN